MNRAMLIGNIGETPVLNKTNGRGISVINFRVATNERFVQNGEEKNDTTWHHCVAWGGMAELIADHVEKGMKVYIEGKIQNTNYETTDGLKRFKSEIKIDKIEWFTSRDNREEE
jgi:single-strand DNA-binding protein